MEDALQLGHWYEIVHLGNLTPVNDAEKLISLQMGDGDEEAFGYSDEFFE